MLNIENWKRNVPNYLTFSRIAIVPFIVSALLGDSQWGGWIAALLFVGGSLTDYFDGKIARAMKLESKMGIFMDPIADKILVTSTLVMLIPSGRLDAVMVIILLSRDTLIGGLRSVAASEKIIISAGSIGKWKTAIQMVSIPCVLIREPVMGIPVFQIGYWILWLSVALSLISGASYIWNYIRHPTPPSNDGLAP